VIHRHQGDVSIGLLGFTVNVNLKRLSAILLSAATFRTFFCATHFTAIVSVKSALVNLIKRLDVFSERP